MIYMISKEQAKAAVEHINGSKYSLATATEVELETLRENNERVSKDVLQHDHRYGIIVPHLGVNQQWSIWRSGHTTRRAPTVRTPMCS